MRAAVPGMDTSSLRSAYADFLELARTGEFRPPVQGWSARQVIAHVAANDEMLAATTQEVHGRPGQPAPSDAYVAAARAYAGRLTVTTSGK
jgi:Mycothiol maleylpyruvate isomerase N-terminal domain